MKETMFTSGVICVCMMHGLFTEMACTSVHNLRTNVGEACVAPLNGRYGMKKRYIQCMSGMAVIFSLVKFRIKIKIIYFTY